MTIADIAAVSYVLGVFSTVGVYALYRIIVQYGERNRRYPKPQDRPAVLYRMAKR